MLVTLESSGSVLLRFTSSVAAICQRPQLVKRIFQGCGTKAYKVQLCRDGIWQKIEMDGYFPCAPFGQPLFASSKIGELFPLILEKAYAKSFGSYSALVAGTSADALADLTGAPAIRYDFQKSDKETIWNCNCA